MPYYVFGKIRCYFCNAKNGLFHAVHDYGVYGDVGKRIFYHPECLEMVEMDPERFGHKWADKAINIGELRKRNIDDCNKTLVEVFEKRVETLHKNHFERMMPKK